MKKYSARSGNQTYERWIINMTYNKKTIEDIEVAGKKGIFYPAETVEIIDGGRIKVRSCEVKAPYRVRYGWQPYTTANLVNSEGLPASTFEIHTED